MSRQVKFRHFSCLDFECCKNLQLFASGRKPLAAGFYWRLSLVFYLAIAVKDLDKYLSVRRAWLQQNAINFHTVCGVHAMISKVHFAEVLRKIAVFQPAALERSRASAFPRDPPGRNIH